VGVSFGTLEKFILQQLLLKSGLGNVYSRPRLLSLFEKIFMSVAYGES